MDSYLIKEIAIAGISCMGLLLCIALITCLTNGLFLSRLPWDFVKHRDDPRFETERKAGKAYSQFVFKYIPPFFIGFVLILVLSYLL